MTTRTPETKRRLTIARQLRAMKLPEQHAYGRCGETADLDYNGYMLMCGQLAEAFGVHFAPYEWTLEELRDAIVGTLEAGEVTALNVAEHIVALCATEGVPVSRITLERMLYALQMLYCRSHGGALLFDDEFAARYDGPSVPAVRKRYNNYLGGPIDPVKPLVPELPYDDEKFMLDGIRKLRTLPPIDLAWIACGDNTPWRAVYDERAEGVAIPNDLIISHALQNTDTQ